MTPPRLRILLTGADGFLGRAFARALERDGHDVVKAVHRACAPDENCVEVDFARDLETDAWAPRVKGMDVVVNTVGLLAESRGLSFDAVHARAPSALFEACARAGVRRVVQISALGADAEASSAFHLSKKRADDRLLALPVSGCVVQPSLVFGLDGASARWLLALSSLPLVPLPGDGAQAIQPVHVDDVAELVAALVAADDMPRRIAAVGPEPLALRDYLVALRASLGLRPPRFVRVPLPLVRASVALGERLRLGVTRETLGMLERGNVADAAPLARALGRAPRPARHFVATHERAAAREVARLAVFVPILRASVSFVWLWTAFVSAFAFPHAASFDLLARLGLDGALAQASLWSGVAIDATLGLAMWKRRWRRAVYALQAAVMLAYTALITFGLPEFWAHPYGPLAKNVPLFVAILMLRSLDRR